MTVLLTVLFKLVSEKKAIHAACSVVCDSGPAIGLFDGPSAVAAACDFCTPPHPATAMTAQDLIAHATVLAYRLAGYALQNMAEDAALLAMMFC